MTRQNKSVTNTKGKPAGVTPMMAQYLRIREDVDNALLFYRMGDFYELFFEDAIAAASALDIALTKRGKYLGEDIPMCGVPVHSAQNYLHRLIEKGFRVAICEQTENPAEAKKRGSKSVVRRELVRLVTAGTLSEDQLLQPQNANRLAAVHQIANGASALAWADISTGEFKVASFDGPAPLSDLQDFVAALGPSEILLKQGAETDLGEMAVHAVKTPLAASQFKVSPVAEKRLASSFGASDLSGFGDFDRAAKSVMLALFSYIELTQAGAAPRLHPPAMILANEHVSIDPATRFSLEITRTQKGERRGSLLASIDATKTSAGARLLFDRLSRPSTKLSIINAQLDALGWLVDHPELCGHVRETFGTVADIERAKARLRLGRGGPRDLVNLSVSALCGEMLNSGFCAAGTAHGAQLVTKAPDIERHLLAVSLGNKPKLAELVKDIQRAFIDTPPIHDRDGGFIAKGWSAKLDELRQMRDHSRQMIARLQQKYADATRVSSLKIKHNNVLGFFVEVTPRHADILFDEAQAQTFLHRQTLGSAVRFSTSDLKTLETEILSAADKSLALEQQIYQEFLAKILEQDAPLQEIATGLAELDVLQSAASWAMGHDAVRPLLGEDLAFEIKGGRHPVVEQALKKDGQQNFTPNDCVLADSHESKARLTFVTGPNMAGKSTWLRQNALIILLAQAGFFVPARHASIGLVDRLFSRVGASDDLAQGRSTFMVEMIETAAILHQATERSFVILDEIGRGTATWDGLAIAWAVAEHLCEVNQCRALFATHYHELTSLSQMRDGISNVCLKAREWEGDLVFLHQVVSGAADRSYGISVAKLAGMPAAAIERASQVLQKLEQTQSADSKMDDLPLFAVAPASTMEAVPSKLQIRVEAAKPDEMSPREALEFLYELQDRFT